jgi:hypothetical protein
MSFLSRFSLKRLIGRMAHDAVPVDGIVFPRDAPARRGDRVTGSARVQERPTSELDPRAFPRNGANFR